MKSFIIIPLLLISYFVPSMEGTECSGTHTFTGEWGSSSNGQFEITVPEATSEWTITVSYSKPINSLNAWEGAEESCDGAICTFTNEAWNGQQTAGATLNLGYGIQYDTTDDYPQVTGFAFNGVPSCEEGDTAVITTEETIEVSTEVSTEEPAATTEAPTEAPTDESTEGSVDNGQCNTVLTNYKDVLYKSLLFYEAQRSGALPSSNRISWRRDSALNDGSDVGVDLTGGYYDAGDYVKFNFPKAAALTVLAWGGIVYRDGYECAGEFDNLLDAIKWGTDYLIKCHVSDNEFYAMVGNPYTDHAWWGRPEDMGDMSRPSYKIDCANPGSDLAAETAASFASASILFKDTDTSYSEELLDHAKTIYEFADTCRGKYSDSVSDAAEFYRSYGYEDELVWGAAWLYKATGDEAYLDKAEDYYTQYGLSGATDVFSWDDKKPAVHVLMAELTGDTVYKDSIVEYCDKAINDEWSPEKSPGGMLWYSQWGSLRYASNTAFLCLQGADLVDGKNDEYTTLAQSQMDYILGDNPNGQSFVIGIGTNYPQNPHHASSSCPDPPNACGWDEYNSAPTEHELLGALVGGCRWPDDNYNDERTDYYSNEVTLDYNAAFQSTIAGFQSKKCCTT